MSRENHNAPKLNQEDEVHTSTIIKGNENFIRYDSQNVVPNQVPLIFNPCNFLTSKELVISKLLKHYFHRLEKHTKLPNTI